MDKYDNNNQHSNNTNNSKNISESRSTTTTTTNIANVKSDVQTTPPSTRNGPQYSSCAATFESDSGSNPAHLQGYHSEDIELQSITSFDQGLPSFVSRDGREPSVSGGSLSARAAALGRTNFATCSTPEMSFEPLYSHHQPVMMTPPIRIHIHRPNSNVHSSTLLGPDSDRSFPSSPQTLPELSNSGPPRFVGKPPTLFSSRISASGSHAGSVMAKLNRRRASQNLTVSGQVLSGPGDPGGGGGGGGSCSIINNSVDSNIESQPYLPTNRRKSWDIRVTGPIRRASQAIIQFANLTTGPDVSNSMGSVFGSGYALYGECSRRDSKIRSPEIMLMYSSFQRLPMKDFGAEVRASMDVDQFLQQAVLLLDITETSLEGIVDRMLRKVIDGREPLTTLKEAKTALFTHDSGELQLLARTIQGTYISDGGGFDYDQSWLCAMCSLPSLARRHVAIARLKHAANMGRNSHEVRFFILVVTPSKEKGTKNALETGRTFATIFADIDFRQKLLDVHSEPDFKGILLKHAQDLASEQSNPTRRMGNHEPEAEYEQQEPKCHFAQGLCDDLRRRTSHYISDYVDGLVGRKTPQKTLSTIFFLYFACILPTIAFGVLNNNNTSSKIDIRKSIIGQTIGGLSFAFLGGQPLVIIMTTAPICLYIKVIYNICEDFQLDFYAMYACTGLWNTFFLVTYSVFDVSKLMKWCTRSTEEIFSLFISIAFAVDAGRDVYKNFLQHYYSTLCNEQANNTQEKVRLLNEFRSLAHDTYVNDTSAATATRHNNEWNSSLNVPMLNNTLSWSSSTAASVTHLAQGLTTVGNSFFDTNLTQNLSANLTNVTSINHTTLATLFSKSQTPDTQIKNLSMSAFNLIFKDLIGTEEGICRRETSLLFLLLMLGTVWMAVSLFNFNKTPYLQASKRELLADYALPCSVIILSFVGSYVFRDIPVEHFRYDEEIKFSRGRIEDLSLAAVFACMGLGFSLSLLFFMDQNISAAMVNNPCNKLKKGCAYHLDLFVVGILNGFLSMYGFTWMHGVLPHSPLHVRSLADVEERVDQGHVYEIIVKVRETRLTGILSHILIGLSVFLIPYPMAYIPTAVLNGLFLYMAITSLNGNQMFERITLLFMEQAAYPPNHYIRRCPQRKIHLFTLCQLVQLGLMCFFGFSPWPYIKMVFPVIVILLLPFRHKIVPCVIDNKYLEALDGENQ